MNTRKTKQPIMYLAIGPSGSGKSTLFDKLKANNPNLRQFSWDVLRLEWYDPVNYANAFKLSTQDKDFGKKSEARLREMLDVSEDIFIDNTNLTPKRRRAFIDTGRYRGYQIVAITFNVDLETMLERQLTRGDKNVPAEAVKRQYSSLVPPQPGEFDRVVSANDV